MRGKRLCVLEMAGQVRLVVGPEQRRRRRGRGRQIRSAPSHATAGMLTTFATTFAQHSNSLFSKSLGGRRAQQIALRTPNLPQWYYSPLCDTTTCSAAWRSVKSCCASSTASTAADRGTGDGSLSRHVASIADHSRSRSVMRPYLL